MFHLPPELIRIIYEYDLTYRVIYNNVLRELNSYCIKRLTLCKIVLRNYRQYIQIKPSIIKGYFKISYS